MRGKRELLYMELYSNSQEQYIKLYNHTCSKQLKSLVRLQTMQENKYIKPSPLGLTGYTIR